MARRLRRRRPGQLQDRHHPFRRGARHRRAVHRDQGVPRQLRHHRRRQLRTGRRDRDGRPVRRVRLGRDPAVDGRVGQQRVTTAVSERVEDVLRPLVPQVLGSLVRRHPHVRRVRGRRPGGPPGGVGAVAPRRRPGEPAGVAADGRRSPVDGRAAQPRRAAPSGGGRDGSAPKPLASSGEPAADAPVTDDSLRLLFLCCHPALTPAVTGRPHAAGGRRSDDGRDRRRLPRSRGDDGPAHQPGQAEGAGRPASRCRPRRSAPSGCGPSSTSCTSCSTRATRRRPEPTWHATN